MPPSWLVPPDLETPPCGWDLPSPLPLSVDRGLGPPTWGLRDRERTPTLPFAGLLSGPLGASRRTSFFGCAFFLEQLHFFSPFLLQKQSAVETSYSTPTPPRTATTATIAELFFPQSPSEESHAHLATQRPEASWKDALAGQESTHSACPPASTKR